MARKNKPKIPKTEHSPIESKSVRTPQIEPNNFYQIPITWRFGSFDKESKWGLNSLQGELNFDFNNEELSNCIIEKEDDELYECLKSLSEKTHKSYAAFIYKLNQNYKKYIDSEIIKKIIEAVSFDFFNENIYPKIAEFERKTWSEIDNETYGTRSGNKSKHHNINIERLSKDAQNRLKEIGYNDVNEIFSLRLDGKLRIFGFRKLNYLDIIWIDPSHEICPSTK